MLQNKLKLDLLKNNYQVINDIELLKSYQDITKKLFTGLEFPQSVFCNMEWDLYFLESWNIFDKQSFLDFKNFLLSIGEDNIVLAPNNFAEYDLLDYTIALKDNIIQSKFRAIIKLSNDLMFEDFDKLQHLYHYRTLDSFIFSQNGNWGIYTNTNIDLMIFASTKSLRNESLKYWYTNQEKITSLEAITDDVYTWGRSGYIDDIIENIKKNYSKAIFR